MESWCGPSVTRRTFDAVLTAVEQSDLLKLIKRLDQCVDLWAAKTTEPSGAWEAAPGSELAVDDAATDPYRISTTAWHSLAAAVDNLRCFRDSLIESRTATNIETTIRLHSHYLLLRGALENSSWTVWTLAPDDSGQRIVRRLRVQATSIDSMVRLARTTGIPLTPDKATQVRRLRSIAIAAGLSTSQVSAATKPASHAEVVKAAADAIGANPVAGVAIWSMGSGVGHADFQSSLLFMSHTIQSEPTPGVALAEFGGSVRYLYLGTLAATATINAGFNLYDKRASV